MLTVNEIFYSIQGESTWVGCPCVFVRLTGCHLRCGYCDTEYAFHEGKRCAVDDVLCQVQSVAGCDREPGACDLVEVTGGEPLLQPGVHELMRRLCDSGRTVLLETSGACDISTCDPRVVRIMDLKTPDSGEAHRNLWTNLDHLRAQDEIKFVLCSERDYQWARDLILQRTLHERVRAVLLSPVHATPPGRDLRGCEGLGLEPVARWMLRDRLPHRVRLQTQLHKLIWDPQARGV